MKGNIKMLY